MGKVQAGYHQTHWQTLLLPAIDDAASIWLEKCREAGSLVELKVKTKPVNP